jgi:hypothetical protein
MGPWIVIAEELDPASLNVRTRVNGELRQNANTRDLIFDIPTLIAAASAGITLYPGDIIATALRRVLASASILRSSCSLVTASLWRSTASAP